MSKDNYFSGIQLAVAMELIPCKDIVMFQATRGVDVESKDTQMLAVADFLETLSLSIRNAENNRKERILIKTRQEELMRVEQDREQIKKLMGEKTEVVAQLEDQIRQIVDAIPEEQRTPREMKLVSVNGK